MAHSGSAPCVAAPLVAPIPFDCRPAKSYDGEGVPALREALQLLDDDGNHDGELTALLSTSSPPSTPRKAATPKRSKRLRKNNNPATEYSLKRAARDSAVADLNSQIDELQRILDAARPPPRCKTTVSVSSLELTLNGEWEQMSQRQKRQRLAAEIANTTLRQFVDAQLKAAQTVERLFHRTTMIREFVGVDVTSASIAKFSGPLLNLESLEGYLGGIREKTDVVLSSGYFAGGSEQSFRETAFSNFGADGLQIELAISCVLPFSVDAIAAALWKELTRGKQIVNNVASKIVHENSNVSLFNFVAETKRGHSLSGTTHGQAISRRYDVARDGSVQLLSHIVMRSFDGDAKCTGTMKGDGWIQLEPMPEKTTAQTPSVTCVKWCRRAVTRSQGHENLQPEERARWVDAMVSRPMRLHWQREMDHDVQTMENLALQPLGRDEESVCALLDF